MKRENFPTGMQVALVFQAVLSLALFGLFAQPQLRGLRYHLFYAPEPFNYHALPAALFYILVPIGALVISFCAFLGRRWALWSSLAVQSVVALTAASICVPELVYALRGVNRGFEGAFLFVASAPIFLVAAVLAVTLSVHLRKSRLRRDDLTAHS